ncbi:MAG: hypothetical protein GY938_25860, partial [Ketobacter sp.]|nr:hypothetical protein [Ketobacter sp.]
MAKSGGQPGNQSARKGTEWRDALRKAIKIYQDDTIKRGHALRHIAKKVVTQALEGDATARNEIANRLDGKPTEYREQRTHTTVETISVQATTDWLTETVP